MSTLYDISEEMMQIERALDDGDLQDEEQYALIRRALEVEGRRDEKVNAYASLIANCERLAEARKAEANRMLERAAIDQHKVDFLKRALLEFFQRHEIKSIETDRFKISRALNGGKAPLEVGEFDMDSAPERFVRTKVIKEWNKDEIRKALEDGEILPFEARLRDKGEHIRIK